MANQDESKNLEELNSILIEMKKSRSYTFGKKSLTILNMLKRCHFFRVLSKIIGRKRIEKISHPEVDNGFVSIKSNDYNMPKILVYTCITGGYDKLGSPFFFPENVDYTFYTDDENGKIRNQSNRDWKVKNVSKKEFNVDDNVLLNRYIKFHPHKIANDYDYAIYVDGNVCPVGDLTELVYEAKQAKTGIALHRHRQRDSVYDEAKVCEILKKGDPKKIKNQMKKYKEEGFPADYGLFECNVIVTDLHNLRSEEILNDWWQEFLSSGSYRDQLALPYVLWRRGYRFTDVGSLGKNVYRNPKFLIAEKTHEVV